MKKCISRRILFYFIMLFLTVVFVHGGNKTVFAATSGKNQCKVTFANSEGKVSTEKYRRWARTVKKGTVIKLPKVTKTGYKAAWETKISDKTKQYNPGSKVTIKKNIKFCLKFYKKNSTQIGTSANSGTKTQNNNSGAKLYKNNGTFWKTLTTVQNQKAVFPSVTTGNGDMFLGWSRKKGKTSDPEYYAGDTIPNLSGKYYMVVFKKSQDTAPTERKTQSKYEYVYLVGDSRTLGLRNALKCQSPENTKFVFKAGEGLRWFKKSGFSALYKDVKSQPKNIKKAVIINLGVNDLNNTTAYVKYMKNIAKKLKGYNCTMYYLSVNPVNNAMITKYRGHSTNSKTEAKVLAFNKYIYNKLCSGKKAPFSYINTYGMLRKNGWISNKNNAGIFDGVHYSNETYLRIYDYCMRVLNR